jgi:hypothetical protein
MVRGRSKTECFSFMAGVTRGMGEPLMKMKNKRRIDLEEGKMGSAG